MKSKPRKQKKIHAVRPQPLNPINHHAAGMDIGATEIWVAVPFDRDPHSIRAFPTFTRDIIEMAQWLLTCKVATVAMEATGVYWIPIYDILEAFGIDVCLIDPRQTRSKKKSDVLDCQHLQQQHSYGLLDNSFRPKQQIRCFRTITRQVEMLEKSRARHIQHMQKALHEMNIQLDTVLTDITGQTGMNIVRAICSGEHDPLVLARFRDPRCKHSSEDIVKALEGSYLEEHLFILQQALQLYDYYSSLISSCEAKLEELYNQFGISEFCQGVLPETKKAGRVNRKDPEYRRRMHLYHMCGVDLTEIDGFDCDTAETILTEIGPDVSAWETVKHFASWTTLAPNNRVSGGKILPHHHKKANNRVAQALRLAARSVGRSNTALGAFYRKILYKRGPGQATKATAHKLARIVYVMLKTHTAYNRMDQSLFEAQYEQRVRKNLERTAAKFNLKLVPCDAVPAFG